MDIQRPPIPTLLAVGAVHHHLIKTGLRTETSIVADTSQCFSTHQLCALIGYGAHAVCPYLALETARQWRASPRWALLGADAPAACSSAPARKLRELEAHAQHQLHSRAAQQFQHAMLSLRAACGYEKGVNLSMRCDGPAGRSRW